MINTVFKKILVPIDGSSYSMKAVDYAIDFSQKFNSEITTLYILYSKVGFAFHKETAIGLFTPSSFKDLELDAREEADKWFKEIIDKGKKKGKQIKTQVGFTAISIVEAILSYAEYHNIDTIIIGSRGRSGFKKLMLGSVASGVSSYSHCPVIIIK